MTDETTPGPEDEIGRLARALDEKKKKRMPKGKRVLLPEPDLHLRRRIEGLPHTDLQLAMAMYDLHKDSFVWGDGLLFVYYNGVDIGYWRSGDIKSQLRGKFGNRVSDLFYNELDTVRQLRIVAEAAGNAEEVVRLGARMTALLKLLTHTEKNAIMANTVSIIEAHLVALKGDLTVAMNADPGLLACANGAVDLRTGQLRHADPKDYLTHNTKVDYVLDVDDGWWRDVVLQICSGDQRMAEYVQVWFGYCATGVTSEHCMAIFHGSGRNGKNLMMDAVAGALGSYAKVLPDAVLESEGKDSGGNNVLYAMAHLHGARFAYISETGEKGKLRESLIKRQTGDKTITARHAFQDYFEFPVSHKLTLGTNHRPTISGTDEGVWSRIRLIPMKESFGTQAQVDSGERTQLADKSLLVRIHTVGGREAVLRWVVEGARKYFDRGLDHYMPAEVAVETKLYRREQDVLGQFLQYSTVPVATPEVDRIKGLEGGGANAKAFGALTLSQRLRVEKMELWRVYCIWCEENGHMAMSNTMFARRIVGAQRFWQDEIGEELHMKPLEVVKAKDQYYYRYVQLSEGGVRLRNIARSRVSDRTHERDVGDF